ncbi:MAG: plasmid pRiA4b ORF-3 family protein [Pseudonocardiaceae bacterium]
MATAGTVAGDVPGTVYRLRVVLSGISPMIWRQLEVPATVTLAQLHEVLATSFAWSGEHLYRFTVHGRDYGSGELWLTDPSRPRRCYPWCSGGARSAPPEDCGGAEAFLALRQEQGLWDTTMRMAELTTLLLEAPPTSTVREVLGEALAELPSLLYWSGIEGFDRAGLNHTLTTLLEKGAPLKITVRVQVDAVPTKDETAERFSEVFVLEREALTEASGGPEPDRSPHAARLDSGSDGLRAGHGGGGRAEPLRAVRPNAPSQGHPPDHCSDAVRDAAPGQSALPGLSVSGRRRPGGGLPSARWP